MKKRFFIIVAITTVFALLLCGCGGKKASNSSSMQASSATSSTRSRVAHIVKSESNFVIKVGETKEILLISGPLNEHQHTMEVTWDISDETIATVARDEYDDYLLENSHSCTVVGLKPGEVTVTAYVTAEDGSCSDSCKIIVEE